MISDDRFQAHANAVHYIEQEQKVKIFSGMVAMLMHALPILACMCEDISGLSPLFTCYLDTSNYRLQIVRYKLQEDKYCVFENVIY